MSGSNHNQAGNSNENFGLPDGYFKRSAGNIMNRIEWEDEHKEFPVLTSLKGENGFVVPSGYFSGNETHLELLEYPTLVSASKKHGFAVPAHYFEEAEILEYSKNFVETDHELEGLERLTALPKRNNFSVSNDYFEVNAKLLASLLEHRRETRIVDLFFSRTAYVAAAMLMLALGLWIYSVYFTPAPRPDCGTLACVDRNEIFQSKVVESFSDDDLMEAVDASDLEMKLNGNEQSNPIIGDSNLNLQKNDRSDDKR